jgi:DNA-binding CsgD family transcriptional regulator
MLDKEWEFWVDHTPMLNSRKAQPERIPKRYYFIFDTYSNDVIYMSKSFVDITGYEIPKSMYEVIPRIHPDDVDYCIECERKIILFLNDLFFEDNFRFNTVYSYRIKTNFGHYIFIKQYYQALEVDEKGFMSKSIVYHEVMPANYKRSENDFVVMDLLKNRPVVSNNIYNLSKRELEIIDFISEGLSTKEISEKIAISEHTIRTHRKNILQKTNTNSFIELIKKLKQG